MKQTKIKRNGDQTQNGIKIGNKIETGTKLN